MTSLNNQPPLSLVDLKPANNQNANHIQQPKPKMLRVVPQRPPHGTRRSMGKR